MSAPSTAAAPPYAIVSRSTELALVAMAVLWGVNFSVVKYATQVMEPLAYNSLRMVLGCLVLVGIATWRPGRRADAADRRRLMLLGILGHCVYQVLFIKGIALTRAGTASLVVAASPAMVAIVARAFGHERLPWRAISGIALSIGGVLLVLGGSVAVDGSAHLMGDLMIFVAVIAWAFYTTMLLPITRRCDSVQVAAWTLVGGVIPLVAVSAPALWRTEWTALAPLTWGAVLYSGLFAMVVSYLIWYHGVERIGPTRTAMFGNLQPIVAVLVAWAALGEVPTAFQGAGAATVIAGLYLARR
jgi:drug/metabolite transporter (DMT)-like permease